MKEEAEMSIQLSGYSCTFIIMIVLLLMHSFVCYIAFSAICILFSQNLQKRYSSSRFPCCVLFTAVYVAVMIIVVAMRGNTAPCDILRHDAN